MRVERYRHWFIVARAVRNAQYFAFFVDDDSSAWSKHIDRAARFRDEQDASDTIACLKSRAKLRRERRAA